MNTKAIVIPAVLLIVTIGNYFRMFSHETIRTVEFLNIWAIGALSGVLIFQITKAIKERKQQIK